MILYFTYMFFGDEKLKKIGLEISRVREVALFAKFKCENSHLLRFLRNKIDADLCNFDVVL